MSKVLPAPVADPASDAAPLPPTPSLPRETLVSVIEWAREQAPLVGFETASAFAKTYPTVSARPSVLASALAAFRAKIV